MYEKYINQLHIEAKLRNLADSSVKTYTDFILRFLEYTGKDPQDITAEDVRNFLLFKQETIAATTLNHYNSAIHFFFRRHCALVCLSSSKSCISRIREFENFHSCLLTLALVSLVALGVVGVEDDVASVRILATVFDYDVAVSF